MARMPDFEMPDERAVDAPAPTARVDDAPPEAVDAGHETVAPASTLRDRVRATVGRIRIPALAFLLGVAVAAVGVTWAGSVRQDAASAEVDGVVASYLAVVESADPDMAGPSASLDEGVASSAFVSGRVVPASAPEIECDEPQVGDDVATVACDVRVERRSEQARIVLERAGGSWSIVDGLEVPVRLQPGLLLVETIGSAVVEPAIARGQEAVWLLPGRYDVTATTPLQLTVDALDGLLVSASNGSVRWTSSTSSQLDADVEASALAYVQACATAPSDGCPELQERDAGDPFDVFAVDGRLRPDDPYALTFDVSIRRPVEQPAEFVVVTVRVDFGEALDRYDVTVG